MLHLLDGTRADFFYYGYDYCLHDPATPGNYTYLHTRSQHYALPFLRTTGLGPPHEALPNAESRRDSGRPCRSQRRQPRRRLLHQPLRKRPLMFKRPSTHYGKSPEPETPYQRAAQVWDDRIGGARVQASNWRLMAFGSLILSAGFAAALNSEAR